MTDPGPFEIRGRTAVVTGAGSGIGEGLARALAAEGCSVVVSDVEGDRAAAVAADIGPSALGVRTDVADRDSVAELAAAARDRFGAVHLLFNNAGVSYHRRGIHATYEDWQWVLGVNLWGVVHGVTEFLPAMLESGEDCHIVNTASMNGIVPSAHSAMYSASKYGVVGLTETLHNELQGTRVGVTALCPAGVTTRITDSVRNRPDWAAQADGTRPPHAPSSSFDISPPLQPAEVAQLTLDGVRNRALYVFTDPKVQALLEAHHATMLAAFAPLTAAAAG
ncbi:SDR family NAD(P)-dependent oxidoreductase [Pseudonocardia halophobica]|uniref:SDR family NAD(P)-dependent oxidoreductase n=1 Tax=Pseudonocardia halophobica TaxID=29401 RepID=UPI003D92556F